jgi:hypothetical protein
MRMLIDLLNNDLGYARIFAEGDGFGYELTTYRLRPMSDLFERMSGYASPAAALEAAQQQLASVHQMPRQGKRRPNATTRTRLRLAINV